MDRKVEKSEDEWKKELTPEQYKVLRKKGTEPAFTGELLHNKVKGMYVCAGCGAELFDSDTKYDSGSGWPSFWQPVKERAIDRAPDHLEAEPRIEVMCHRCGAHLGHVFDDGPPPTGLRFCINSLSLGFKKKDEKQEQP